MTVCIAAVCETSRIIVTASDRLVSWGHTSSDTTLKAVRLHDKFWLSMLAGDDITRVEEVTTAVREMLTADKKPPSVSRMRTALRRAWRDVQNQIGAAAVLNPYRMDVPTFVRDGRKRFGDAKFYDISTQLAQASKVGCHLLVCGFDHKTRPTLFVCDDEHGCRDFTRAGYIAIGSGWTQAMASLAFHDYTSLTTLADAVYHICAAKFMSERSLGVGRETLVLCFREDGQTKWIFKRHIDFIRQLWEQQGRPRVPKSDDIAKTIGPILSHQPWQVV